MTGDPTTLVVVGAAAGIGQWLVNHLLLERTWDRVVLVDADWGATPGLDDVDQPLVWATPPVAPGGGLVEHTVGSRLVGRPVADLLTLDVPGVAALVAVPHDAVAAVVDWLVPLLATDAALGVVTANQSSGLGALTERWPAHQVFGLHPLFDVSARSVEGRTFLVVGPDGAPRAGWLTDLIGRAGAISDSGSAADHDAIMRYVQTLTHQTLISFADAVTTSGLDLQHVWEARTPLFEGLFGLSTRVLSERQQSTVADIQLSMGGGAAADELGGAVNRWRTTIGSADPAAVESALADIRERFSGTLFDTVQGTAASAVSAAQGKLSELARHRRDRTLVGIRPVRAPQRLRVGEIVDVTPVSVRLRPLMAGDRGRAVLLEGPGAANAARVGVAGTHDEVEFGLGHIDLVVGDELDATLDEWLTFIRRDVRFLVPESVAGLGVLTIVAAHGGVRDATVVSEVVRTGQRAVNIRVFIRADHDVDGTVESLRAQVQRTYRWPSGLALAAPSVHRVHFLGPAGTFSEAAARQAAANLDAGDADLVAHDGFDAVLASVGPGEIAVLPISSSASGLVSRAVDALLAEPGELVAGGVVDVAVRIDAYVQEGRQLGELRGRRVLSHPQALGQCQGFIRRWGLEPVPCSSTADALRQVADDAEGSVALAGADSVTALKVAEREVDDLSGSITRFLILGDASAFGDLRGGWDPTLRSLWVSRSVTTLLAKITPGTPAFDELLCDADGRSLWVTSRVPDAGTPTGDDVRSLGRAPWSPRTPVVRVEVDVPRDRP